MNECNLNQMLSLSLSRIKHKQMADQVFISIASNRSLGLVMSIVRADKQLTLVVSVAQLNPVAISNTKWQIYDERMVALHARAVGS